MATDQALHGLDNLELGPDTKASFDAVRLARKTWAAAWPKLLAESSAAKSPAVIRTEPARVMVA